MYVVVMAGGGGTRLWPLSRPERPKPFLPLLGDERGSLLQETVRRLGGLDPDGAPVDVTVVTDQRYEQLVRKQLPDVRILTEPAGRNTAAAVALATVAVDRPDDDVMIVLPADHYIRDERLFVDVVRTAATGLATGALGADDALVTLGIQVSRPATEYGYLIPRLDAGQVVDGLQAYPLKAFEEKPKAPRAEELLKQPGVAWNAGMFAWRRRAIRSAFERYSGLIGLLEPTIRAPALLAHAYEQLKPVSIDVAVMESAARDGRVVMGAMDVGWSDIGNWSELLAAISAGGSGSVIQPGDRIDVAADDLVVRRADGAIRVIRPLQGGSMTATQPIAVLRGADQQTVEALLARCTRWEEAP